MLNLIGLGLGGVEDLTLKGLRILKEADYIYLESYTSVVFNADERSDLESELKNLINKEIDIHVADRDFVESNTEMIDKARLGKRVAFIVVGDSLSATTHTDLILRAMEEGIEYQVVHNASIITAVGISGLQLYHFGETVSIPYWDKYCKATSFIDKIDRNLKSDFHTLCLLDIKVKEQSMENVLRGRKIYEPPRFMNCRTAAEQMLESLSSHPTSLLHSGSMVICLARVGSATEAVVVESLQMVATSNEIENKLGGPLHCMIVVGRCHPLELDFVGRRAGVSADFVKKLYEIHSKNIL